MSPQRDKYLEALGIPDFLYSSDSLSVSTQDKFKLLVVEIDSQGSFCQAGASQDLLFKMLASIGLGLSECNLLSISKSKIDALIQDNSEDLILVMDSSISFEGKTLFVTNHPKDIINNPKLKRDSWEVLKQVKLCLK
jgi:DNA polymerase III psi subunit